MKPTITKWFAIALLALLCLGTSTVMAQGVTTAAIAGKIQSSTGEALPGANIIAVHTASGTTYGTSSRPNGRYTIPNVRAGGPFTVTVSFVGYKKQVRENVYTTLSQTLDLDFTMVEEAIQAAEVVITAERSAVMSAGRTGASTNFNKLALATLPSISGKFQDFARLTPEARSGSSYVGQDNRYNNTTIDGSYFNNSFGLAGQPGDRTGVAPISLDAIEQVQINIAPYDVRQGNFVGAGVNTVTKSGTNSFFGTVAYGYRNQGWVGTKAGDNTYNPGTFNYNKLTLSLGGPIIKNKLFFFVNYEGDKTQQPGTVFTANPGGANPVGNMTRVLASDLDALSSFLQSKFGYNPGTYQGYNFQIPGKRYLAKLDFNLDQNNKLVLRYNRLDSQTDVLLSNSTSLGFGNRRSSNLGLNFSGSNYSIMENNRSIVGEWSSIVADNMSNNLIVGYNFSDESRGDVGTLFPFVDILNQSAVYTSFGSEPFTPNNELRYWSYQLQDNFTVDLGNHVLTFGISGEKYHSENVFFPGKQSAYVYNSLADFYTDANDYLANPTRTTSPVTLNKFQVRYINIPGMEKPIQPLDVTYVGAYAQDEFQVGKSLRITAGLRFDIPSFGATGFDNANADALSFKDENGNTVQYNTAKLPDASILFSPRVGFNWDVTGERTTQVRGGTGVFTGKPAYVWISNQIGNTGVLTGLVQVSNTKAYPFNPNPDKYKPTTVTGAPAATYELALTDPTFKFPQQWRSNIAVDQKLPFGLIATAEFLYGREINGIYYINANQTAPNTNFTGPDTRPRWTTTNKINAAVQDAVVMKNENLGYSYSISGSIERALADGFYGKVAYNYGVSKTTVDASSIAFGSWNSNAIPANANNAPISFSYNSPGPRVFASLSYRQEYFNFGATTVSLFYDGSIPYTPGSASTNASYVYANDLNGDGNSGNDLIYVPRDISEMNFVTSTYTDPVTKAVTTFTPAQQATAWDAYINQDKYLSTRRGQYAERGGIFLPMVFRADVSIVQDVFADLLEKKHTLEIRLDVLNVGNLINKSWGVSQSMVSAQPLIVNNAAQADAQGRPQYSLRNINGVLMDHTFQYNAQLADVFSMQLSVKYFFN
jgi:outer membrane receptor protein involved in Fe transport